MGSRPCEARNDLLNRWVRMQREGRQEKSWEKPSDPGAVQSLAVCERWRQRISAELDQKLERLYNEPLPEAETRFLNDEANAVVREIRRWEIRIAELGGVDHTRVAHPGPAGELLNVAAGHYQYFGRARELPGVRALLDAEKRQRAEAAAGGATREALLGRVGVAYYALDDDGALDAGERATEAQAGAFASDPVLAPAATPTDAELRTAVERLARGEAAIVIVAADV
jgi:pre-mRNA-splicing factor ISY1